MFQAAVRLFETRLWLPEKIRRNRLLSCLNGALSVAADYLNVRLAFGCLNGTAFCSSLSGLFSISDFQAA